MALLIRSGLGNLPDLEDVAQEALVALFKNRDMVDPARYGLLRYTFAVARNRLLDRKKRLHPVELPEHAMADPTSALDPDVHEHLVRIWDFFYELEPLDRYILWRHVVEGQPVSQVAAEVGLYWHKAAGRIKGALQRLQRRLGERQE